MKELLRFLEIKKHCLIKFLSSCEQYNEIVIKNHDKALDQLTFFENNRQSLINIIKRTDQKIKELLDNLNIQKAVYSAVDKTKINFYIRENDSIISRIIKLDTDILSGLEKIKKTCSEQISVIKKGKKAISGYVKHDQVPRKINTQI